MGADPGGPWTVMIHLRKRNRQVVLIGMELINSSVLIRQIEAEGLSYLVRIHCAGKVDTVWVAGA